jgi:riboflavin kinase/FMN adenylyltransferase
LKIYNDIKDFSTDKATVVTIGTFDGLHCGHKKIINVLKSVAAVEKKESVLITFHPHPQLVINPKGYEIKLINSIDEKIHLIENTGIDNLVIIPFNEVIAQTDAETFVKKYLIEMVKASEIIVGYDHHFGKDRSGRFTTLVEWGEKYGFSTTYVDPVVINDVIISSTKIRKAINEGDISNANILLGYDFFIEGKVIQGKKIGRRIGYPTANIDTGDNSKIIPADGIYLVKIFYGNKEYFGMSNIGIRPTFDFNNRTIEVNIFDFDKDIYGEIIRVSFIQRLRDELKFENEEKLKEQIFKDKLLSLEIIKNMQ